MNRREVIERVASGLRNMQEVPIAFLYLNIDDQVWDEPEILGIPVYYSDFNIQSGLNGGLSTPCRFVPLWGSERDFCLQIKAFFQGWEQG
jgi:hypothetical protein